MIRQNGKKRTFVIIGLFFIFFLIFSVFTGSKTKAESIGLGPHDMSVWDSRVQGCASCHAPHVTYTPRLWERPPSTNPVMDGFWTGTTETTSLCLDCHAYTNVADLPDIDGFWGWGLTLPVPPQLFDGAGNFVMPSHPGADYLMCTKCHVHYDKVSPTFTTAFSSSCELCHGECNLNTRDDPMYGAPDYPNAGPGVYGDYCEGCHKPGTVPDGSGHMMGIHNQACDTTVNANSHYEHMVSGGLACANCHYDTIREYDGSDGWELHAWVAPSGPGKKNGRHNEGRSPSPATNHAGPHTIDLVSDTPALDRFGPDSTTEYSFVNGNKRCFKSCHGTFTAAEELLAPQWGGELGEGCFICHPTTEVSGVPRPHQTADSRPNGIDIFQYVWTGHGSTNDYSSKNSGAAYTYTGNDLAAPGCNSTSGDDANPVDGCHSSASQHFPTKSNTDPFRLGSYYSLAANGGVDGFCLHCHDTGKPGSSLKATSHTQALTGSSLSWDLGTAYDANGTNLGINTWQTNPPKCVDCHDPHGDENAFMVKNYISRIYGSTEYGAPSVGSNIPNEPSQEGCVVCHEIYTDIYNPNLIVAVAFTLSNPVEAGDYYNLTSAQGENLDNGICQICHTKNLVYNNIKSSAVNGVINHRNNLDPNDNIVDFLPADGRRCTECHFHGIDPLNLAESDRGFKVPNIDWSQYRPRLDLAKYPTHDTTSNVQALGMGPRCTDCHVWNPGGDVATAADGLNPLLASVIDGGVGDLREDTTDHNDDVDDYLFGSQPAYPGLAAYNNRAMVDKYQWYDGVAHGTPASQALLDTNYDSNTIPNGGPEFTCAGVTETVMIFDVRILQNVTVTRPVWGDGCHDPR
ncbi:hypothetical protein ACFL2A_06760, partial [Thermodesulfobacteriota bacterium]